MVFNNRFQYYAQQAKLFFVLMAVGFFAITALCIGFIITAATFVFLPFFTWFKLRGIHTKPEEKEVDFIETEYEIIEDEEKK